MADFILALTTAHMAALTTTAGTHNQAGQERGALSKGRLAAARVATAAMSR
jgi:hypothetical protein